MQQIINFFIRNKNFILFLLLFVVSLGLTIQSHSYHKSKFINSANWLTGGVYESISGVNDYFSLKERNQRLIDENLRLRKVLFNNVDSTAITSFIDSTSFEEQYIFRASKVIKNSFNKPNNTLTINSGASDSIKQDMGVITSEGIVGIIDQTSSGYATVISVLHENSSINAKLKNSNQFGTLGWNGEQTNIVQLTDIPRLASVAVGDTVITGGMSTIFPKGVPVGTIVKYALDQSENYYLIDVQLFADMTNLGHVYVIENKDAQEILSLQEATENE